MVQQIVAVLRPVIVTPVGGERRAVHVRLPHNPHEHKRADLALPQLPPRRSSSPRCPNTRSSSCACPVLRGYAKARSALHRRNVRSVHHSSRWDHASGTRELPAEAIAAGSDCKSDSQSCQQTTTHARRRSPTRASPHGAEASRSASPHLEGAIGSLCRRTSRRSKTASGPVPHPTGETKPTLAKPSDHGCGYRTGHTRSGPVTRPGHPETASGPPRSCQP